MDFSFTQEQQALQDSVKRFCEREYGFEQRRAYIQNQNTELESHWHTFAGLGWLGAGLEEEAGGFGGGPVENSVILEQFGSALVVEPLIAHIIAVQLLKESEDGAASELIEAMVAGERRLVLAHFGPRARGDLDEIGAVAEESAGGIRLRGHKSLVHGAAYADSFLVSASDGDGVSLFHIDADTPGLECQVYRTLDNHQVADLWFDDVAVNKTQLIGRRGAARGWVEAAIDHGIVGLCAEAVGAMEAAMLMTRDYLKTRQQFGTTLNNFQALQHRMADMVIQTELSRSMLYQALAALAQSDPMARKRGVSAAKVQIAESGVFVGAQAIQLHGGIGVTEEYAVGHYYKRLFVIAQLYGNADYHRDRFCGLK